MMIAELNSEYRRSGGTRVRGDSRGLFRANHQPPSIGLSLRLPVTPENRSRLRALRKAELHAWNRGPRTVAHPALRTEVRRGAQDGRRASRTFAVIAVTTVAVALGAVAALRFVAQHGEFVAFLKRLLGLA